MSRRGEPCHATRGSRNGSAKLDQAKADQIRALLAQGLSQEQAGAVFGVTQALVSRIKRGLMWTGESLSEEDRFEANVLRIPFHPCWEWIGTRNDSGYGVLSTSGSHERAHRLAWERANGRSVPLGLCVLHTCDNRGCVRPDHLFLGTRGDNNSDCAAKNRNPQGEVHHWAKLTEDQAAEVRERARSGEDRHELADLFGVSYSTVKDIENGRSWRHQEGA